MIGIQGSMRVAETGNIAINELQAQLAKADLFTEQISGSLSRLSTASRVVENAIKPISGSTQVYATISKSKQWLCCRII